MFIQSGGELWKLSTYPRVGDASLGVFKGREEPHGQVMSHVQQLVVIILNRHVAKGLLGVGYYSVGRKKAPQDPNDRKNKRIIIMLAVQSGSEWWQQARIPYGLSTAWIRGPKLTDPLTFFLALYRGQSIASKAYYWKGEGDPFIWVYWEYPLLVITLFGHRHHLITREWPHQSQHKYHFLVLINYSWFLSLGGENLAKQEKRKQQDNKYQVTLVALAAKQHEILQLLVHRQGEEEKEKRREWPTERRGPPAYIPSPQGPWVHVPSNELK